MNQERQLTALSEFEHKEIAYIHVIDLTDDSTEIHSLDGLLMRIERNAKVYDDKGADLGHFRMHDHHWVFEPDVPYLEIKVMHNTRHPDSLLISEVELAKQYLDAKPS